MLTTFLLSGCLLMTTTQDTAEPPAQTPERIEVTQERTLALDYLVAVPEAHDPDGAPVPVILFLHGAGERGDDLDRVKSWGPARMVEDGHDFGAVVITPQCPADTWWTDHVQTLELLLDHIEAAYNIDPDRIYVTGLSMGGYGTFALVARNPGRYAAAVPICGGGSFIDARRLGRLPIWAFHGDADNVIPVDESRRMIRYANASDGEHARLTEYEGVGHNSWSRAYADEAMWEWLFAQRRGE